MTIIRRARARKFFILRFWHYCTLGCSCTHIKTFYFKIAWNHSCTLIRLYDDYRKHSCGKILLRVLPGATTSHRVCTCQKTCCLRIAQNHTYTLITQYNYYWKHSRVKLFHGALLSTCDQLRTCTCIKTRPLRIAWNCICTIIRQYDDYWKRLCVKILYRALSGTFAHSATHTHANKSLPSRNRTKLLQ